MGRSPVLATVMRRVSRPALSVSSPSIVMISPGIMALPSADRMMHGHQLGAVGKGRFDLHFADHLGDTFHDVAAIEQRGSIAHEFRHRTAVAGAFEDRGGHI